MSIHLMYPHLRHAHWPESAAALSALGSAEAFTRCLPPPSNQLTVQKEPLSNRPLPSVVGFTFLLPAIGSLPLSKPWDSVPWRRGSTGSLKDNYPGPIVTEQSDFPRGNHSFAFAAQKTCSFACQARYVIHPASFII